MHGADEVDLVHSGLERNDDLRRPGSWISGRTTRRSLICVTAAYVSAINKVGTSYKELGIFP